MLLLTEITNTLMNLHDNFKQAMSRFATGVCIMTYRNPNDDSADGVTISAFSSLSLAPTKILFCLGNYGQCGEDFAKIDAFAVNILSSGQTALAYQFAGKNRDGIAEHIDHIDGLPVLKNTLATVICRKGNHYTEGDHDIIIGDVSDIVLADDAREPLLYYQSKIIEDYRHEQ